MTAPCIVVADDHPLFRDALSGIISAGFSGASVVSAKDLTTTIKALEETADVDLVLLDLNMPGVQGFSGLIFLRGQYPTIPIIVVSGSEDLDTIRRSVSLGASGFIPKSSDTSTIKSAMNSVLDGGVWVPDQAAIDNDTEDCLLYTSPSPRDLSTSRMPSSA